jgi:phosphonate transport system substrate-binding protein
VLKEVSYSFYFINHYHTFRKLAFYIIILAFLLNTVANTAQTYNDTLRFGHISVEDPAVTYIKYKPLLDIISGQTGYKVILIQKITYSEMNEAFINNEIDMGILNSFSYIQIEKEADIIPLARRVIETSGSYRSYIIIRRDSEITGYTDLKGRVFAFSDPDSTTGYLLPRAMLINNSIDIETDLADFIFIGKHDSLIYSILNRTADAGAVASYIFDGCAEEIKQNLYILDKSGLIPLGPFVIKKNLGIELADLVKEILLNLNSTDSGLEALNTAGLNEFEEAEDSDYDIIRSLAVF